MNYSFVSSWERMNICKCAGLDGGNECFAIEMPSDAKLVEYFPWKTGRYWLREIL